MGMRTIRITSPEGRPDTTNVIDDDTGKKMGKVQRIEFADLHVDMSKPWTAILHRHTGEIVNDEWIIEEEQVNVIIGESV